MTSFGPTLPISQEIHQTKYRELGETFEASCYRVSSTLSDNDEHRHALSDSLLEMRFLPAGRVQAAIGSTRRVTPWNCFVSGVIADDFNDIMEKAKEAGHTMRLGGGIGYDFSTLRPRGSIIKSLGSQSSGPVSFMDIYDAVCSTISSAGHRRGAQMGVLRVDHPDIEEFIHAKTGTDKLKRFNISVGVTDAFMEAVKVDGDFSLRYKGQVHRTVKARRLWDAIMRSTWDFAEPGVLFLDRINHFNNLWYCETLAATNPCVSGDTEILTQEYGYRNIDSLLESPVTVWNGFEWSKVWPRETGTNQDMVLIKFSNGRKLECTKYHGFYLSDGSKKLASELEVGDRLLKHEWPIIGNPNEGPMIDFLSDAYTQGFFAGDGWEDQRGRQYIGLYDTKRKLEPYLLSPFTKHSYKSKNDNDKIYLYYGKTRFKPKIFVPGTFFPVKYRKCWLAGLADSDGYLTKDGHLQISSKNYEFLINVSLMLNTLGITGTVNEMKDCWRLSVSATHAFKLDLPTKRLQGYINPQREADRFVTVVSVEDTGIADKVYCFSEYKRHSGIFGGVLTAQCGEQPLPPYGACLLGSFNLTKYVKDRKFDYDLFHQDISTVVRAMDNVIDVGIYPLPQQEEEGKSKRRMGLGLTGVANALEYMGLPYGTPEFLYELETILIELKNRTYLASAELAKEKGPFPLFDKERYLKGKFIQTLYPEIQGCISEFGIRNSHLLSIAPTGTISLAANNISSGIEPVFSHSFDRTIQTFEGPKTETVEDYGYRVWGVKGVTANNLSVDRHVDVLCLAQKYVDSSVSKTCNVGDDVTWEDFKGVYMKAYEGGAKGCTTFRKKGKLVGILKETPPEEFVGDEDDLVCRISETTGQPTCS